MTLLQSLMPAKIMHLRPQHPARVIEIGARIFLGAVFVYASWDKILDPAGFAQAIANYQIVSPRWVNPAALLLPWLELTCGLCLIIGRLVRGSALVILLLILIFLGALGFSIARGLDIQCGCFTAGSGVPGNLYLDLFRDLGLLTITLYVLLRSIHSMRPGHKRPGR